MRLERNEHIDRLLARRPDIRLVTGASGNGALIRANQVVAVAGNADVVHERARQWIDRREDDGEAGVAVFHLRPGSGVDECDLAIGLSDGAAHKRVNAGPNHVVTTQPGWRPSPFDDPAPADAIPRPSESVAGDAVTVAILDTGVTRHPWFDNRTWLADCDSDAFEVPDTDHDDRLDSVAGHGTFIAGVVLQQSPGAHLLIDRIVSGDGVTDEHGLVRGLARLRHRMQKRGKNVDIVSLSLGCYTHDDKPSPVVEQAVNAFERQTVIVACAGNAGSDRPFWPAALKRVVAVGALDASGHDRAGFSNYGWWVDACTLGEKVVSSFFSYTDHAPSGDESFTGYASWSGTSFAAPRIAGAIAARAAADGTSAAAAASALLDRRRARSMPDLGVLIDVPARPA